MEQPPAGGDRGLPASSNAAPIAETVAYKTTRFTDLVVQRRVRLYPDRLQTQHDGPGDSAEKTWVLDRSCKLEPESADDLQRQQRAVRPPGTWTVTAAATAKGHPIELFCLAVHWPASWLATKAYTSCGLCFSTRAEAQHWHRLISRQLGLLRLRGASCTRSDSAGGQMHSRKPSAEEEAGLGTSPAPGGLLSSSLLPSLRRKRPATESPSPGGLAVPWASQGPSTTDESDLGLLDGSAAIPAARHEAEGKAAAGVYDSGSSLGDDECEDDRDRKSVV